MTPTYADLEISLRRRDEASYNIDLRFSQPDSDADNRSSQTSGIRLDFKGLKQYTLDPVQYGRTLAVSLFGPEVREDFNKARSNARSQEVPLRVRLFIDPSAPELHSLRWETLRDPDDLDSTLLTSDHYYFSRYLSSNDWQPVRPRAKSALKALVVVANPDDLDPAQLAPVDVAAELGRAKTALSDIFVTALACLDEPTSTESIDVAGRPTLQQIQDHLRADGYDILYLVCHGDFLEGEPRLYLENEAGHSAVIAGRELVVRLQELQQRPRLVVLASCQSAGAGDQKRSSDAGVLAALGPRLAEIGVPAVLAMQGNISMQTIELFMPKFFTALQEDGQIDRAAALARGVVRNRPDWWMPVLFMRLKSGRLWYTPGFADDKEGSVKWKGLLNKIHNEECIPILGPGLTEPLFGERRSLAYNLAKEYGFPLSIHAQDDLPQVSQYVAVNQQDSSLPRREFMGRIFKLCGQRYVDNLPDDLRTLTEKRHLKEKKLIPALNELIKAIGRYRCEQLDLIDAYHDLARLPFPIYITTDPTNLLVEALIATGKQPQRELCYWHSERFKAIPSIYEAEPKYIPDTNNPLVYHLFGHIEWPSTLVLTEDDYFDYLIGLTSHTDLIPKVVRAALVSKALLFLGFKMDDWNFRVLFRSIMNRGGSDLLDDDDYPHIAAQITPDEDRVQAPDRARRYLEDYFQRNREVAISIYWGSSQDFITDLHDKWDWEESMPK